MKPNNPTEPDPSFLYDPSDPDGFREQICGCFEGNMKEKFGRVIAQNNLWDFAIGLSLDSDPRVAFRGSWALEWAYYNDKEAFRPYAERFVDNFLATDNPSVHRIYAKMLYDMCRRKILILSDERLEAITEKLFGLLINSETKIAVKGWCMELLFDFSLRLDWVEEPLREVVGDIMENEPSRGIANCGGKILKRIDRRRSKHDSRHSILLRSKIITD